MPLEHIFYNILLPFLVVGTMCFFLERRRAVNKNIRFFKSELDQDISFFFFNAAIFIPLSNFFLYPFIKNGLAPFVPFQFFDQYIQQQPFIFQIFLGMLIFDLITYWRHRFTHRYMWRFHSIHHNAQEMSWTTKHRLHPIDYFVATLFSILLLYLIGFSGQAIVVSGIIVMVFDYWNHCNFNFGFKSFLRFFLSSPQYHHWHHAAARQAMDKNFVVCFPFLDIIFGSYYYPIDRYPDKYGLMPQEQAATPKTVWGQFIHPFRRK